MPVRSLRQSLSELDLAHLRVIARFWEVDPQTLSREALIARLLPVMMDPERQGAHWTRLGLEEQEALRTLVRAGGAMPSVTFQRRFGEIRRVGAARLESERLWERPTGPAEALWFRGWIFLGFVEQPAGFEEVVFIPDELLLGLPAVEEAPRSQTPEALPTAPAPVRTRRAGTAPADDFCTLLSFVHNEAPPAAVTSEEIWAQFPILRRQLRWPQRERWSLLWHLAGTLQMIQVRRDFFRLDPEVTTRWLQAPLMEQLRALLEAWRDSVTWNDLFHVPTLRPEPTGSWQNDPRLPRQTLLQLLARLDPGCWYAIPDLIQEIKAKNPTFQRTEAEFSTWYIRDVRTGDYLRGFENWDQVEGALLRYLLTGPLHWLGMVDLGEPDRIRLSPFGAAYLGKGDLPPDGDTRFVLLEDGTIEVGAARRYERFQITRIADWVASGEVYRYRITARSLARARGQNIGPERILDFFQRYDLTPSEALSRALMRWANRGTEATVKQALVLRVNDPELLRQLLATEARRYVQDVLSPVAAIIHPDSWASVRAALLRLGVVPEESLEAERGEPPGS
ncbi:helicase-associated domain-containing protein [Thermoflexus sp.]|uniref:helicase-associated domain-containing protein n=1 Tax=Thermoflexus sp. TaxID=1969742 RepID=UPI0025E5A141|nr:helicase-associated domain-containing protein [Thermoflexus sp.]MDW8181038.1 helicase-associated domain-containing protein [Anaerolineae bacterium]MDW8183777.1 helicase-associated domain-containing protein [Anaerolineae bacterium]